MGVAAGGVDGKVSPPLHPHPRPPSGEGCCFGVNDQVNPYLRNLQPLKEQLFPTLIQGQSFHPSGKRKKKKKRKTRRVTPAAVKGEAAPSHADHSSDNKLVLWQQPSHLRNDRVKEEMMVMMITTVIIIRLAGGYTRCWRPSVLRRLETH